MANKSDLYKRKVLKELCFGRILSGSELSARIEKSLPLTTRILNELAKEGIVEERGFAASTGGRRPMMYSLISGKMYVVSVAMDQLITTVGMMDLQSCDIFNPKKFSLPLSKNPGSLEELGTVVSEYINGSGIDKEKIIGVGIGMPGFVDSKKGINYSFLESHEGTLTGYLENILELPVFIDNDSSLIALSEFRFGAAHGKKNVMVININWGVGLGMIVNGDLFRGHNGFAGEFSHIPVFNNNKLCSCGKSGCLETEASMLVVVEKAKEGLKNGRVSTIQSIPDDFEAACTTIMEEAVKGDQFAVELFSEAAFNIGRGLAFLIHIMNPELIVLSGRGASLGKLWLAPVQQALNRYCIPRLAAYTELAVSTFNKNSELIGAAALVIESYDKQFSTKFTEIQAGSVN
jgi:predicted NBD/HSP70 family sugar kinase